MVDKKIIKFIGIYLIADGIISILYFQKIAIPIEQLFRIIRIGIGAYLIKWH